MNSIVATTTFYVLVFVTLTLQFIAVGKRAKFLKAVKGQRGPLIKLRQPVFERSIIMFQLFSPFKLPADKSGRYEKLKRSAEGMSVYCVISLLLTLLLPVLLFNLTS
jgi:hypothetical protein